MFADLSTGTLGLRDLGTEALLDLAARHGFGGLDVPSEALESEEAADRAAEGLARRQLQWGLFALPADFLQGDDAYYQAGLERLREIAPRAARAGCRRAYNHIWPGSREREYADNFRWHVERVRGLVEVLAPHGIQLGLEFIGPKTLRDTFPHPFLHTLSGALELADAVDPSVGVVLDSFHWYCSGGTLEEVRALDPKRIVNVHLNDAQPGRAREEQQDLERALPMEHGIIDTPALVRALREGGYQGPAIVEPFSPTIDRFRAMPPDDVAAEVMDCFNRLFAAASTP